jgi:hypothetical protein
VLSLGKNKRHTYITWVFLSASFIQKTLKSISSNAEYIWSCTEKLDEEKSKHAGLAQENGCGSA